MKSFFILSFLFIGCNSIQKETEVRRNAATGEDVYAIYIWKGNDILKSYQIPMSSITDYKVDSLNKVADSFFVLCKKYNK